MHPADVYKILRQIGATHLHHANSVITSCTFLEQGGLLSRAFVEDHGLEQTPQPASDEKDRKYGIWDRIFVDHVDIHDRGGRRKGPNFYGPVLFQFAIEILLHLPEGADVRVTKRNPVHWYDNEPDAARWFQNPEELAKNIHFGDFDKMLVIQTAGGKLEFPNRTAHIILDDPHKPLFSGEDAFTHAENRLKAAAAKGQVKLSVQARVCQVGCICLKKYEDRGVQTIDLYFG